MHQRFHSASDQAMAYKQLQNLETVIVIHNRVSAQEVRRFMKCVRIYYRRSIRVVCTPSFCVWEMDRLEA